MPNIKISDLEPAALPLDGAATFFEVQTVEAAQDVSRRVSLDQLIATTGLDATFVTVSANAQLPNERILTEGAGISIVDAGPNSTITVSLDDPLLLSGGSVAAPTYSFAGDPDTGVYNPSADVLGFAAGGVQIAQAVEVVGANQFIVSPGVFQDAPATPSLAFGDGDTGLYEIADDNLAIATAGVLRVTFAAGISIFAGTVDVSGGDRPRLENLAATLTVPNIIPFTNDSDTGIGANGADSLALIAGGVQIAQAAEVVGANQFILTPGLIDDNPAAPTLAFGDGDSGFYEEVDDTIAVALEGAKEFEFGPITGADPDFSSVELLTNLDGPDGATSFTEQSNNAAVATFVGGAELDTAQFKFGTASLLLDGLNDYLHFPDIAGYTFGSNLFTIEGFVRFASLPAVGDEMTMVSQWVIGGGTDRAFAVSLIQDGLDYRIRFESEGGVGVFEQGGLGGAPALNTWHYFTAQRSAGDTLSIWWNGLLEFEAGGIFTGSVLNNSTTTLKLGVLDPTGGANAAFVDGWIDEVRITNGVARYATGGPITVPTSAFPTNSAQFTGAAVGAGKLFNQIASLTSPTLVPRNDDDDTGIGGDGSDILALIAGGVEGIRVTEAASAISINTSGPILAPNGAVGAPSYSFASETNSGMYYDGQPKWSVIGTEVMRMDDTGVLGPSASAPTWYLVSDEAATNTNPIYAFNNDNNSGIGGDGSATVSIIADSIEIARAVNAATDQLILHPASATIGAPAFPALQLGSAAIGFNTLFSQLRIVINGVDTWRASGSDFGASVTTTGPGLVNAGTVSLTTPGLAPIADNVGTGIGSSANNNIAIIVDSGTAVLYSEATGRIVQTNENEVGLTASVTQTQAGGLLLRCSRNEIQTVANAGDALTAFAVTAGTKLEVINNGANSLQLFPALGDNIGAGVNTAIDIESGHVGVFLGRDATNWDTLFNGNPNQIATGGATVSGQWQFDSNTTEADPGQGLFRNDNATIGSVTEVFINSVSETNADFDVILGLLGNGDQLYIQNIEDATEFMLFDITANVDNGGWYSLAGSVSASNANFTNGEKFGILLLFGGGAVAGTTTNSMLRFDGAAFIEETQVQVTAAGVFSVLDAGLTDSVSISHNGAAGTIASVGSTALNFTGVATQYFFDNNVVVAGDITAAGGNQLVALDTLATDSVTIDHDGTDGNITCTLTADLNFIGAGAYTFDTD